MGPLMLVAERDDELRCRCGHRESVHDEADGCQAITIWVADLEQVGACWCERFRVQDSDD